MTRLLSLALLGTAGAAAWAQGHSPGPGYGAPACCKTKGNYTTKPGPGTGRTADWLDQLKQWRKEQISKFNITFAAYEDPAVNWTRTSYVQPQVHLYDRYLYDDVERKWTVDKYLADLNERYGGIDSVLIWPTYPNIGIDSRNQFDMFRAMPGGLDALKTVTDEFHSKNVRVLWGYNPWDQNLNAEPNGEKHWDTMAKLQKQTGGDGFNGDTMNIMYKEFWDAGVKIGHKMVGEMEGGGYIYSQGWDADNSWESMNWNTMGWGYFFADREDGMTEAYSYEPPIDSAKFLDPKGRRMTHVNDRWSVDRRNPMQIAHFNGVGYESWENVWGVFMHFTDKDGEALKRLQKVWKFLGTSEFIQNYQDWVPYAREVMDAHGVYASRFQHAMGFCAYTVVNRDLGDAVFNFDLNAARQASCRGHTLYDLFTGEMLSVKKVQEKQFTIEGFGYGAFVLIDDGSFPAAWKSNLDALLPEMRAMTKGRPLSSFSSAWSPLKQTMVPAGTPDPVDATPAGMVLIERTQYKFQTAGVEIEGGCNPNDDTFGADVCCTAAVTCPTADKTCKDMCAFGGSDTRGVDVQFPWEDTPRRFHSHTLDVGPFYIDKHLVTNAEFKKFVDSGTYKPKDTYHYFVNGTAPGRENKPVTWVSLKDARAYCKSVGKRLPHTWEWQLAAQGEDGRPYPWGTELEQAHYPTPDGGPAVPELPDVGSYPTGASPYGVEDLFGFVWQYTDEFADKHTRGAVLKGSSLYNPVLSGSFPSLPQPGNWYFPPARKLTRHNRLLLMDDSYERAATVGFRCVADHKDGGKGLHHLHETSSQNKLFV